MRAVRWGLAGSLALAAWCAPAHAEIDDEHLFGFTEGTDIGRKGDKEIELEAHGRFGKRWGSYSAVAPGVEGKFTILDDVRVSPAIGMAHHHVGGVPGLNDHDETSVDSFSFETKVRVIDRTQSPIGVTLGFTPSWARVDGETGERVTSYGAEFLLSVDREIISDRLLTAFNLVYDPATTRSLVDRTWSHKSSLGISGAIAGRIIDGIFLGAEMRYLRAYDGMGLDRFSGHALFVGPTFYAKLSDAVWMAAVWNVQVAGRSNAEQATYDLANFERHEVAVRVGIAF